MGDRVRACPGFGGLPVLFLASFFAGGSLFSREDALLYRTIVVPESFLAREEGHEFAGDLRIGDLNGDGRCDFLVYRCEDRGPGGPATGGFKPCFLGAFEEDGTVLWKAGGGGTHPVRPSSVAIHDVIGDSAAEVICFWQRPPEGKGAGWDSLADIVVQVRDGRSGAIVRESAPREITSRRCLEKTDGTGRTLSLGRRTANWVHQRILVANFRGTDRPRDFLVKLGDTHVAFDEHLDCLWTHRTEWVEYSRCPAYIPAVGDVDGDGRDEVNSGYFLLDDDGSALWERRWSDHMDSVAVTPWDGGRLRAICSGGGHVIDERGAAVLTLGEESVPHGQEVRVANFRCDLSGPEMVLRHRGHTPGVVVVSSETGRVEDRLVLNSSPTNVGMEAVSWNGPGNRDLLYNGGWLWDVEKREGAPLPGLPAPGGGEVHRMGFHHAIAADLAGDRREELVIWDPTGTRVFLYTPVPFDASLYAGYRPGPRQYNPRIMD